MSAVSGVAEQSQDVEVGIEERLPFVGSEREVAICNLVWDSFLNVRAKASRRLSWLPRRTKST